MATLIKDGTISLNTCPSVSAFAAAVGKMEGEGPLASSFDYIAEDVTLGESSWEKSESKLQQIAFSTALSKGSFSEKNIDVLFAGDLLNQCVSSSYGARDTEIPFLGLFGACSTMAEGLGLASVFVDSGSAVNAAAVTSSHFCSAERQFRLPVNYGGQRTPTAQWTATAAGCAVVSPHNKAPYVRAFTVGKIKDMGITDANNMGAAMAAAAYDTVSRHLCNTGQSIDNFDLILTGDLGKVGRDILIELFKKDGVDISEKHNDCGIMLFDPKKQDVHAGGSGCGCSASVLCSYVLDEIQQGKLNKVLFAATGALMSPTIVQQGESIPGISHAVELSSC
ncbi:MAG TPA: stage V sporulation protein AD [Ruminococcaceae bacterium]|nr:stage V sporulation protein AD [Oscillospiraceae bacterium]